MAGPSHRRWVLVGYAHKTDDITECKRIKIYNSRRHSIHNKPIVYYEEIKCPLQLETCLKSMLYNSKSRIKNRKDFFNCSLLKIKKAFKVCIESIKCKLLGSREESNSQMGGSVVKITYYENKLKKLYDKITISTIA